MKLILTIILGLATCSQALGHKNSNDMPSQKAEILTPEKLWSMGRLGQFFLSDKGDKAIYNVTYYNIQKNAGQSKLYLLDLSTHKTTLLTTGEQSETSARFLKKHNLITFLAPINGQNQIWTMNIDGTNRKPITNEKDGIIDFLFSPDETHVILIKEIASTNSINAKEPDLPLSSGMVINDLMYKHWDQYITSIPHPFLASFDGKKVNVLTDILKDEPYECPSLPFGGIEQLNWSPDSKEIVYSCRKKTGINYATSTDSDIFLYDINQGHTINLCKDSLFKPSAHIDYTRSLKNQPVNKQKVDYNMGYDTHPQFSPDGKYISWLSMERDGYESDRTRLCIYDRKKKTKKYVTESFQSGVNDYLWKANSKELFFTGVWHGKSMVYQTDLKGEIKQLTDEQCDYSLITCMPQEENIIVKRQSMSSPEEIFVLGKKQKEQLTHINSSILEKLEMGEVKERWVTTVDGKKELCWVIYPPHFNANKKYPTLLFCEGGPQSPVSQSWSYRWNFQLMAANGYIIIAPNRRGLPGFGMEWLEEISENYTGLCMQDYLSAIDDISKEPYVNKNRLGCIGASFGGFSVYWLAGHHNKRFKCFIAHDGIYNTQQQYVETEELWFPNWDMGKAPWIKGPNGKSADVYENSPHLFVDKWDTPILCIHGQRDFRIEYTQAESAFTAAKLRGIPAQLLLFPDENHWVLKPQNGILWQRTFFRWLNKWLKSSTL